MDMKRAINYMADFFENSPMANGQINNQQYGSMRTPLVHEDDDHESPQNRSSTPIATGVDLQPKSDGEASVRGDKKRDRGHDNVTENGDSKTNGHAGQVISRVPIEARALEERAAKRFKGSDQDGAKAGGSGSEEGEI